MRQGTLTIQQDGTLTIAQGVPGDATAVEAAVATFAERVSATETQASYRLTAAAVWHARRTGQTLADTPGNAGDTQYCRAAGQSSGGDHTVEPAD